MPDSEDQQTFKKAEPYIRSLAAFSIYLRCIGDGGSLDINSPDIGKCYSAADKFLDQLEKDIDWDA